MGINHIEMHGEETIETDFVSKSIDWMYTPKTTVMHLIWRCRPLILTNVR